MRAEVLSCIPESQFGGPHITPTYLQKLPAVKPWDFHAAAQRTWGWRKAGRSFRKGMRPGALKRQGYSRPYAPVIDVTHGVPLKQESSPKGCPSTTLLVPHTVAFLSAPAPSRALPPAPKVPAPAPKTFPQRPATHTHWDGHLHGPSQPSSLRPQSASPWLRKAGSPLYM